MVSSKRVLVVDDEAIILEVVRSCLEDIAGWTVITASSAKDGLMQAVMKQPDAILLDVMMPGVDGLAMLQQLKGDPELRSIPVLFVTAKDEFIDPRRFRPLGAVGAIAKPFLPAQLVEQVSVFLGWELIGEE
ncbi:MAG: response regulator [Oculatellaceae cyanobacterium Prado106]|jgi:CheY-like chemotaxis protein|nr:response regulator [Oculatellaceae cyanobacterium Prado106]